VTVFLLLALACADGEPVDSEDTITPWKPEGGEVVSLTTRDGVAIEADLYAASSTTRPALVLVHMDPSSGAHRGNWPGEFLQLLVDSDWNLIVPDRRGAGGSGGVATDAFETVAGAWDIEACALELDEASTLSLVAASNGTTSMIDYAALAEAEGWTAPETLTFVSVVGSTTNNHEIADVPATPAHFTYPTAEADNNEPWKAANPGGWSFQEYDPGAHGTRMFESTPELAGDLHAWLDGELD
jgi:pimeloyl-ACP methyl ester carboxylesterase